MKKMRTKKAMIIHVSIYTDGEFETNEDIWIARQPK